MKNKQSQFQDQVGMSKRQCKKPTMDFTNVGQLLGLVGWSYWFQFQLPGTEPKPNVVFEIELKPTILQ
jgi:hypothetical protein